MYFTQSPNIMQCYTSPLCISNRAKEKSKMYNRVRRWMLYFYQAKPSVQSWKPIPWRMKTREKSKFTSSRPSFPMRCWCDAPRRRCGIVYNTIRECIPFKVVKAAFPLVVLPIARATPTRPYCLYTRKNSIYCTLSIFLYSDAVITDITLKYTWHVAAPRAKTQASNWAPFLHKVLLKREN